MIVLRRKLDHILSNWKRDTGRKPLIVKGARQIGKTYSISKFGRENYTSFIPINFILQPEYLNIFSDGFDVDRIVKNISFINPELRFVEGDTLILFDELQECPSCATALKSFAIDGRYDVICSGSLMGLNYKEIESNAVGYVIKRLSYFKTCFISHHSGFTPVRRYAKTGASVCEDQCPCLYF